MMSWLVFSCSSDPPPSPEWQHFIKGQFAELGIQRLSTSGLWFQDWFGKGQQLDQPPFNRAPHDLSAPLKLLSSKSHFVSDKYINLKLPCLIKIRLLNITG